MKKALTILLAALLLLSLLAACGGSKAEGTYVLNKVADWTIEEYADLFSISVEEAQQVFKVVLKSGGKADFYEDGEKEEVNWKLEGEKLTLTADGESVSGTLKDGVITLDLEGETMELIKK